MQLGGLINVWENATKGDNCGKISNSVLVAMCQGVSHVKQPLNNLGNTKVLQSCSGLGRELGGTECDHRDKGKDTEMPWPLGLPI